jgi:putative oxidoreductase
MNIALWILQGLLAVAFLMAGGFKLLTPAEEMLAMGMTAPILVLRIAGITELLGALGLILPSALRIKPRLTSIAASLLAIQVGLGVVYHLVMGEVDAIVPPLFLLVLCGIVAYGRFFKLPILSRVQ